jgi:hypothetical protein
MMKSGRMTVAVFFQLNRRKKVQGSCMNLGIIASGRCIHIMALIAGMNAAAISVSPNAAVLLTFRDSDFILEKNKNDMYYSFII